MRTYMEIKLLVLELSGIKVTLKDSSCVLPLGGENLYSAFRLLNLLSSQLQHS